MRKGRGWSVNMRMDELDKIHPRDGSRLNLGLQANVLSMISLQNFGLDLLQTMKRNKCMELHQIKSFINK